MLTLENITCGYTNEPIVHNISFEVLDGEHLCIVGPNGCGKSTLLKAIVGILGYSGEIKINNQSIRGLKRKEVARKIAFMSQISTVYFSYSVFETVMLGRYAVNQGSAFADPSKKDVEFVYECLRTVNMMHLKDRSVTDLSGGELQRVFLARTFAQEPEIIVLDEPTNHLDLKHQLELIEHLKQWSRSSRRIVIAVLHDINLALALADKILVMSNGRQVAFDGKSEILAKGYLNQVYGLDVKKYMRDAYEQWNV